MSIPDTLREERSRNLRDAIRHARWEATMVKEQGEKWFLHRDRWLIEAWKADSELLKTDRKTREALIKTLTRKPAKTSIPDPIRR